MTSNKNLAESSKSSLEKNQDLKTGIFVKPCFYQKKFGCHLYFSKEIYFFDRSKYLNQTQLCIVTEKSFLGFKL